MKGRIFASLLVWSLFIAVAGDAQKPDTTEKSVWTLQFIKVKPEEYASTIGRLDDQWMRIREEAKRQGAVLRYERISNAGLVSVDVTHEHPMVPEHKLTDPISIVLVTEYANMATYLERDKLFASIGEHLSSNTPRSMLKLQGDGEPEEHLFHGVPAEGTPQLKYLAKQ